MSDYWADEYKPAELARLRQCATSPRGDRTYLEALIAHWENGGESIGALAIDLPPGVPFRVGVEIEAAVEDIYLRARGQAKGRAPERRYVTRMENARKARSRAAASRAARADEGPKVLRSLLKF